MRNRLMNKGFTLIELVIVIVLLGILAATALPKFASLTDDAYDASLQGMAGAFGSAVNIAHAQWLADGNTGAADITLQSSVIGMTASGWPAGGSGDTTLSGSNCVELWTGLLQNPPNAAISCTGSCEYAVSSTSGTNCTFQDQKGASGANQFTYTLTDGSISVTLN